MKIKFIKACELEVINGYDKETQMVKSGKREFKVGEIYEIGQGGVIKDLYKASFEILDE